MPATLTALRTQAPARIVLPGVRPEPGSVDIAAAQLRAATRNYEQHVIAWHALGRITEVRAARDAIAHCEQKLDKATRSASW